MTDENYDRLWKMRAIFDKPSDSYAKYYSLTKHSAVDEIIVLFKGRVIFKQYVPKKHKWFGIKIYKLCDSKGYTYSMTVYLGKDRKRATPFMTATHATVTGLTARIEHMRNKMLADGLGNRQRSYSSIFWTLQYSTAFSFSPLVVENDHTENSD